MKNHVSPDFSASSEPNLIVPSTTRNTFNVVCVDPRHDPRWQQLLHAQKSSVFHSQAWLHVLSETYGWEMQSYIIIDHAGTPVAGVPFCRVSDMLGSRIVSLPFSDFCDPLVTDSTQWSTLSNKLIEEGFPVAFRCVHNTLPLSDPHLTLSKKARWHGLDLQPSVDEHFRQLPNSSRWYIRRAQREGLTLHRAEREEDMHEFFVLHQGVRKRKYHLLAQPYEFFTNVWRHFLASQQGVLFIVRYNEQVIGSAVFLEWQEKLYYKFSATAPAHLRFGASELLIWAGIQYGIERGLTMLDFGLSDWDQEGLINFKRKFATEEKTIAFLRYTPEGIPTSREQETRNLLPHLTDLLTDEAVPDHITERAGALLYRFFA
jgi:CelD/BcsL family acetyltransferase involved in cellulose biosynthesis